MNETAQQILESKGYDNEEVNAIISSGSKFSSRGLDRKVRQEFKVEDYGVHL